MATFSLFRIRALACGVSLALPATLALAGPEMGVLDVEWAAREAAGGRPASIRLEPESLDPTRDGGMGAPSNPSVDRRPAPTGPTPSSWAPQSSGQEGLDGSQSVSTGVQATGSAAAARFGVDVGVPADRAQTLGIEPDPILRRPDASGAAGASLEVKPALGPLSGIKVEGKAAPTAGGGNFGAEFSHNWKLGDVNVTGRERYEVDQPMHGLDSAWAPPTNRLTHGLGVTLPNGTTGLDLSATRTEDASAPGDPRWTRRLEGSQSIGGPLQLRLGVQEDLNTGARDADLKAGVKLGF